MTPARARALVAKAPENEGLSLRDGVTVWTPPLGMRPPQEGGPPHGVRSTICASSPSGSGSS